MTNDEPIEAPSDDATIDVGPETLADIRRKAAERAHDDGDHEAAEPDDEAAEPDEDARQDSPDDHLDDLDDVASDKEPNDQDVHDSETVSISSESVTSALETVRDHERHTELATTTDVGSDAGEDEAAAVEGGTDAQDDAAQPAGDSFAVWSPPPRLKSEAHQVAAVVEAERAPTRSGLPMWMLVLAVVLAVVLTTLVVLMLARDSGDEVIEQASRYASRLAR